MRISAISNLNGAWSPELWTDGIRWMVRIFKSEHPGPEQFIGADLFGDMNGRSPDWSISAIASIKLLSFTNDDPKMCCSVQTVFDRDESSAFAGTLIGWNELFDPDKNYVRNDTINLEIEVISENPNNPHRSRMTFHRLPNCCDYSRLANWRVTVSNIENLMALKSPIVVLNGSQWYVRILKRCSPSNLSVYAERQDQHQEPTVPAPMAAPPTVSVL